MTGPNFDSENPPLFQKEEVSKLRPQHSKLSKDDDLARRESFGISNPRKHKQKQKEHTHTHRERERERHK